MPDLPLMDGGRPVNLLNARFMLLSFMLTPDDLGSATTALKLFLTEHPSRLEHETLERHKRRALGGSVAASVFLVRLQLQLFRPSDSPDLEKAYFIVVNAIANEKNGRGVRAPSHPDTIRDHWYRYRRAGHLWAAHSMLQEAGELPDDDSLSNEELKKRTIVWINYADHLLMLAESNGFRIDDDPWRVPESFPREAVSIPELAKPDDWTLQRLAEYVSSTSAKGSAVFR
jgi:hypothetical protein